MIPMHNIDDGLSDFTEDELKIVRDHAYFVGDEAYNIILSDFIFSEDNEAKLEEMKTCAEIQLAAIKKIKSYFKAYDNIEVGLKEKHK